MTSTTLLSQLSGLYEMQLHLLTSIPAEDCAKQYHPQLASLNWYFGRGVYLELHWLRAELEGDDDLALRVNQLFSTGQLSLQQQCAQLPPVNHLINWGSEVHDEHLRRLATPAALPDHPILKNDRIVWFLLQEQAKLYECMLILLNQRSLQIQEPNYVCNEPLIAENPHWETKELSQGHYRIGSRDDPRAYDNELPPQAVELSSYRIALSPVSNAQYLAFMQDGGYEDSTLWRDEGKQWLAQCNCSHPEYWRQDGDGGWYETAINGYTHLPPHEPVTGICLHEAHAFSSWIDRQGGEYSGAIIQHEYQWEMATRTGVLDQTNRAWEWCGNTFHSYPEFKPFPDSSVSAQAFDEKHFTLRGGSLHTQQMLRRASFRHWALPSDHHHFATTRLVFPARHKWS
ncbi:MAG: SUMF1/EgtB/PvdO family nonheme iron enzyme [Candidatus Thiodiazotropha sp. (ex Lucinoma borealis)]|nr:SUMF1/EgtB/PvdO family nonheme iron enzyme [Candidatus Thiodiazotropha sp. (ex Lucinoma borealis)]MCU7865866.1 SUMF1/EgtB/PvdO family nonheme iron enzyme [Candidatus Thiodiazotropha sp. (ex Lucinoma borealis)]